MKVLITVISSLFVGLAMASSNFSPIHELQYFLGNKRRLLTAAGLAVTGYIALASGVLISLIEGALQSDAQGFLMWSSLFSVASLLGAFGVLSLLLAKMMIPPRPLVQESMFAELGRQLNVAELLDALLRPQATAEPPPSAAASESVAPEPAKESVVRPAPGPVFHEPSSTDLLHH